jgi:hypothetical protein
MSDIVSDLAAKSGITPEQAQKGLGAVLSFLKESVPEDDFAKVKEAVPESDQMMAAAGPREEPSSGAGVLAALAEMTDKLFGGGGASALLAKLSSLGITAEQIRAFLPRVLEFLKGRLPDATVKQLSGLLPEPQEKTTT